MGWGGGGGGVCVCGKPLKMKVGTITTHTIHKIQLIKQFIKILSHKNFTSTDKEILFGVHCSNVVLVLPEQCNLEFVSMEKLFLMLLMFEIVCHKDT